MRPDDEELYQERIQDHYEDPYHRGRCRHCTHFNEDNNPLCGDVIRLELQIDGNGTLKEVYFNGDGCCISQAAASMLVEKFDGRSVDEVKTFTAKDMLDLFGVRLTPNRQKCCLLSWRVLQAAIFSPVDGNGASATVSAQPNAEVVALHDAEQVRRPSLAPTQGEPIARPHDEGLRFDPEKFRPDFPILARMIHDGAPLVYLDNAATSQRPRQVIEAIVEAYQEHYANVHRGIHTLSEEIDQLYENAREKIRAFINAPAEAPEGDSPSTTKQVIFTSGTTHSINLVARSWGDANVRAGDEILLTEMEHHSNLVPWYQLAERTGAVIRHIPLTDDGRLRLDRLDTLLNSRTKLVSVTAVSNVLGTINPIDEIIPRAHDAGALVLVDGAQAVPHMKIDVQALDIDFLAFSGHKMLGPSGVGVLYGKLDLLEAMPPFMGGGGMIKEVTLEGFRPLFLPGKLEAGTPPIVPAVALGAAVDYLNAIGMEAIAEHEHQLTRRAHEVLDAVGGVRIIGPAPEHKAGIVSFVFDSDRPHAHDVAQDLDRHYGVAIRAGHHCTMPLHKRFGISATARASFYLYNTPAEIDKLGEALEHVKHVFRRK
jgi:cysteine desulfurase / selenocysteine lyase